MRNILYFLKEAFVGFRRNFSTAFGSVITIFLSLLIIGIFLIAGLLLNNVVESVEQEVEVIVYLADDAADEDVAVFQTYIEGLDNVASVSYISKDQALENYLDLNSDNADYAETLLEIAADGDNPLPASFEISLSDPQQVSRVASDIMANTLFSSVCDCPDNPADSIRYGEKTVEKLFSVTNYLRIIGIFLICLLIFIAFVFINNTIRLAIMARNKEITIMRLVGASNGFIRGPFLMEGALHAVLGSCLAIISLQIVRDKVLPLIANDIPWLTLTLEPSLYITIYLILLGSGLAIGLFGSALAMGKYLKA